MRILMLLVWWGISLGSAGVLAQGDLNWRAVTVQGVRLRIPAGWQVSSLGPGQVQVWNAALPDRQAGVLLFWDKQPLHQTAQQVANAVPGKFNPPPTLMAEQVERGVLSRLYRWQNGGQDWLISLATFPGDARQKAGFWLTVFAQPAGQFNALGGAMFPLAVLGQVPGAQLAQAAAQARQVTARAKAPGSECHWEAPPPDPGNDALVNLMNVISQPACPDPNLSALFGALKAEWDAAFRQYVTAQAKDNQAFNTYLQTLQDMCSTKNARSQQEAMQIQQSCQASIAMTSNAMTLWHQTNMKIIGNIGNQTICYVDRSGVCR